MLEISSPIGISAGGGVAVGFGVGVGDRAVAVAGIGDGEAIGPWLRGVIVGNSSEAFVVATGMDEAVGKRVGVGKTVTSGCDVTCAPHAIIIKVSDKRPIVGARFNFESHIKHRPESNSVYSFDQMLMRSLHGNTAIVTGGAHRVGKVIALALAEAGADIALHYGQNVQEARQTIDELRHLGRTARMYKADLGVWSGARELGHQVLSDFGHVDILVNSASSFVRADYLATDEAAFDAAMDVNIKGPFALGQVVAEDMIRMRSQDVIIADLDSGGGPLKHGNIINIVDEGAMVPRNPYAAHGVSKSALLALTRLQAAELGPYVRVNAICPGPVLKPSTLDDAAWQNLRNNNPLRIVGSAEQVAECVMFLIAGPHFITGDCIMLEGGANLFRGMRG